MSFVKDTYIIEIGVNVKRLNHYDVDEVGEEYFAIRRILDVYSLKVHGDLHLLKTLEHGGKTLGEEKLKSTVTSHN